MHVTHDGKLLIAIGRSRTSKQWQNREMLWSEFLDKLAATTRTRETVAEYAALSKSVKLYLFIADINFHWSHFLLYHIK